MPYRTSTAHDRRAIGLRDKLFWRSLKSTVDAHCFAKVGRRCFRSLCGRYEVPATQGQSIDRPPVGERCPTCDGREQARRLATAPLPARPATPPTPMLAGLRVRTDEETAGVIARQIRRYGNDHDSTADAAFFVMDRVDGFFRQGAFGVVNALLAEDFSSTSIVARLALLSATLVAVDKLPNRPAFVAKVREQLAASDPERVADLLKGIA